MSDLYKTRLKRGFGVNNFKFDVKSLLQYGGHNLNISIQLSQRSFLNSKCSLSYFNFWYQSLNFMIHKRTKYVLKFQNCFSTSNNNFIYMFFYFYLVIVYSTYNISIIVILFAQIGMELARKQFQKLDASELGNRHIHSHNWGKSSADKLVYTRQFWSDLKVFFLMKPNLISPALYNNCEN